VAGVSLPPAAVQATGTTGVVFVVHDRTLERRAVRLGPGSASAVNVISGLTAGEHVAVGDFAQLRDGARIRIEP
jgi:multidrug efflux pump subunit AcrA (membrane-fusion protein)